MIALILHDHARQYMYNSIAFFHQIIATKEVRKERPSASRERRFSLVTVSSPTTTAISKALESTPTMRPASTNLSSSPTVRREAPASSSTRGAV